MRIYLIGFMGSGKSLLGHKLSKKLNLDFVDLDTYIEKSTGYSIEKYFELYGESQFRKVESACLKEIALSDNFLLATGGGTPCFFDNMDLIKKTGISIYLNIPAGVLCSRLFTNKSKRPLLDGYDTLESLKKFIDENLAVREKHYQQAGIIIDWNEIKLPEILRKIKDFTA